MSSTFNHSPFALISATTRTQVIAPVASGTTVIVFAGTLANVDDAGQAQHWATIETYDGVSSYTKHFNKVPVPYGSTSKLPRLTLLPGESLWITADVANAIACRVEYLVRV